MSTFTRKTFEQGKARNLLAVCQVEFTLDLTLGRILLDYSKNLISRERPQDVSDSFEQRAQEIARFVQRCAHQPVKLDAVDPQKSPREHVVRTPLWNLAAALFCSGRFDLLDELEATVGFSFYFRK
jgi:hypothetical protein